MLKVAGCRFFFKDLSTNRICQCLHGSRFTVHGSRWRSWFQSCQLSTVNCQLPANCDLWFRFWKLANLQPATFNFQQTSNFQPCTAWYPSRLKTHY